MMFDTIELLVSNEASHNGCKFWLFSGGTQITISGYGFPCGDDAADRVMVAVGDKNCRIMSVCHDEIVCKIALGGVSLAFIYDSVLMSNLVFNKPLLRFAKLL